MSVRTLRRASGMARLRWEMAMSESHLLLTQLLTEFSAATGWSLKFSPVAEARSELGRNGWSVDFQHGENSAGRLELIPPDDSTPFQFPDLDRFMDFFPHSARRRSEAKQEARRLDVLLDVSRSVSRTTDVAQGIQVLLKAAVHLTNLEAAVFFLLAPDGDYLHLRGLAGMREADIPVPHRLLADSPFDIDALTTSRFVTMNSSDASWLPDGWKSGLCLAVECESTPMGTLWGFSSEHAHPTPRDCHVWESLAIQLAALLERSVLRSEHEEDQDFRNDLMRASNDWSPQTRVHVSTISGLEIAVRSSDCQEMGGDVCDAFASDNQCVTIAVGDASGHNLPAALVRMALHGGLRALHPTGHGPKMAANEVLRRLNEALFHLTPPHQFASFQLAVVDLERKCMSFSNGGHPGPLLLRNGTIRRIDSDGMILGVLSENAYGLSTVELCEGDILVFYSDGITEAMGQDQNMFGLRGLREALLESDTSSAESVANAIWEHVATYVRGARYLDDRTLLVARVPAT